MTKLVSRREVLKDVGSAGVGLLLGVHIISAQESAIRVAGQPVEIAISPVSANTVRLSVVALENGKPKPIPYDGSLVQHEWSRAAARVTTLSSPRTVRCGDLTVKLSPEPLTIRVEAKDGRLVQQLRLDQQTGAMSFSLGDKPVLAFGEGGPQFDRRGQTYTNRNGQGGYQLRTHGGRVPIQWLIGTVGWAMFIHNPL